MTNLVVAFRDFQSHLKILLKKTRFAYRSKFFYSWSAASGTVVMPSISFSYALQAGKRRFEICCYET